MPTRFRPPRMTYQPRVLEAWEAEIAFTIAEAPFDVVAPVAAEVVRARQGPTGVIEGERRPPAMALSDMQAEKTSGQKDATGIPIFEGVLIYAPAEASHLTVIEHPLDFIGPAGLPEDLGRVMDKTRLFTFDSSLDTRHRQFHGLSCRVSNTLIRRIALSRGHDTSAWHWEETGDPLPFEDATRLDKKRVWERLDRTLLFDYAARLGLDPAQSLFGRKFATSVLYYPLPPDAPEAASAMADIDPTAAFDAGVEPTIGLDTKNPDFAETASLMAAMMSWERALDQARWKAHQSAKRAKTPAGREQAQRRVIEITREVIEDMRRFNFTDSHISPYISQLNWPMRELGKETDAYRVFKGLVRHPFWVFWRR